MKTRLLMALFFGILSANAQTTHNISWFTGANTSQQDKIINVGDTVKWTWTDAAPHDVQNTAGSSVETFNSGIMTGNGSTYSHTFTIVGNNDYFCGVHGAGSMNGRITVQNSNLGVDENGLKPFKIVSNPVKDLLVIELTQILDNGQVTIHDLLGKIVLTKAFDATQTLSINVSELNLGLYLISIESGDKKQTQRFIKN